MITAVTPDLQPYIGPRPFEREDELRFFGREREANELASRIISSSEVVLYAQSGAGKTSLINARLMPILEQEGCQVLRIARVQGPLASDVDVRTIKNLYAFHVLASWEGKGVGSGATIGHLARTTLGEYLAQTKPPAVEEEIPSPCVVVFDQFEELFTFYPERWPDRSEFFKQVRDALLADPSLRVVFSMREDYIAELDPYVSILPGKLRTRFRLERLREKASLAAVTGPVERTSRRFGTGVAEKLVRDLMETRIPAAEGERVVLEEFVEPVQLQVVCQSLWDALAPDQEEITFQHLEQYANVDQALYRFYEQCIEKALRIEGVNEGILRRWFGEVLITPEGTRGIVFKAPEQTVGIPNAAINLLDRLQIIRPELRGGGTWYELTHDRLITPIREANLAWLRKRAGAEDLRRKLEETASEWARKERSRALLLNPVTLYEAERWLESPAARELGATETLRSHVATSRAAISDRRRRRYRALAAAAAAVAVFAAYMALMAWTAMGKARAAEGKERSARQIAVDQRNRADQNARSAAQNAAAATAAGQRANRAARLARLAEQMAEVARRRADQKAVFLAASERKTRSALTQAESERARADLKAEALARSEADERMARHNAEKARDALQGAYNTVRSQRERLGQVAKAEAKSAEEAKRAAEAARKAEAFAEEQKQIAFVRLEKIQQEKTRANDAELADRLSNEALALFRQGDPRAAIDRYNQVLNVYRRLGNGRGEAATLSALGRTQESLSLFADAERAYRGALAALAAVQNQTLEDHASEAVIDDSLGNAMAAQGRYMEAEQAFQQALAVRQKLPEAQRADAARSLDNLGSLYVRQEQFSRALDAYQQAMQIRERSYGSQSLEAAESHLKIAAVYAALANSAGKTDEKRESLIDKAGENFRAARDIYRAKNDQTREAAAERNIAGVYRLIPDFERAENHLKDALRIQVSIGDLGAQVQTLNDLASLYSAWGKNQEAEAALARARSLAGRVRTNDLTQQRSIRAE
jgi:tetratricopeptide (TPR) repeat protein